MNDIEYIVGLDLGQAQEFTALAVLERPPAPKGTEPVNAVRHLERFPIGTSYTQIVGEVTELLSQPPIQDGTLIMNQSGVGQAVMDLFQKTRVAKSLICVNITVAAAASKVGSIYQTPKKDFVSIVQVLLQARRLKIANELTNASTLVQELENFRTKAPAVSNDVLLAWREGQDDDLVFAVALACWWAERRRFDLHAFLDDWIAQLPPKNLLWEPVSKTPNWLSDSLDNWQ